MGAGCVVPAGPLGDGDLDRVDSGPGALVADELGLVQGVEAYQGIVVGARRGHRLAVGQGLPVANGSALDSAVGSEWTLLVKSAS